MNEYDILKNFGLVALKKIKAVVTNKYLLAITIFFVLSFFIMEIPISIGFKTIIRFEN